MEDINGETGFAQYSTFLVGSPSSGYKLTVLQYAGNSGCKFFFNLLLRIYVQMRFKTINFRGSGARNIKVRT